MNKLTNTALLLFVSILTFAQRQREGRFPQEDTPVDDGAGQEFATPGGNVPIDDYKFLLLGLAVLLIAYFVYRSRQTQKA